jgi:hypothetical protein
MKFSKYSIATVGVAGIAAIAYVSTQKEPTDRKVSTVPVEQRESLSMRGSEVQNTSLSVSVPEWLAWSEADYTAEELAYELPDLCHRWAEKTPEAAYKFALSIENHEIRYLALDEVLGLWVEQDADAAKQAVKQTIPCEDDPELYSLVMRHLANLAPASSTDILLEFTDDAREAAIKEYFAVWAEKNHTAAIESALQFEEMRNVLDATGASIDIWAQHDMDAAVEWVLAQREDEEVFFPMLERVVDAWSAEDVDGAADYVAALPETDETKQMVARMASNWAQSDPEAVFNWVHELSTTHAIIAARSLVLELSMVQYENAAEWANTLQKEEVKAEALSLVIDAWKSRDKEAALEWKAQHM